MDIRELACRKCNLDYCHMCSTIEMADEIEKKIHNEAIESCLLTIQEYKEKDRNEYPINYGTLLDFENMFRDLMIKD